MSITALVTRADAKAFRTACKSLILWWPGTELNRRRQPFQGCALPAELPGHGARVRKETDCSTLIITTRQPLRQTRQSCTGKTPLLQNSVCRVSFNRNASTATPVAHPGAVNHFPCQPGEQTLQDDESHCRDGSHHTRP